MPKLTEKMFNQLEELYADLKTPGKQIFSSITNLFENYISIFGKNSINKNQIIEYLRQKSSYTKHKMMRNIFPRRSVDVCSDKLDGTWAADIAIFIALSRYNFGYKYVLLCCDILSGYVWTAPMRKKNSENVVSALQIILENSVPRKPDNLWTDRDAAFYSEITQTFLESKNIKLISTFSGIKSCYAEQKIKFLKNILYRAMTETNSWNWVAHLSAATQSMNLTKNRILGISAADVTEQNCIEIYEKRKNAQTKNLIKKKILPAKNWSFNVGDTVRISMKKNIFKKGYEANFSTILYKVTKKFLTFPHTYEVSPLAPESKNLTFEPIVTAMYSPQMTHASLPIGELPKKEVKVPKWKPRNLNLK